MCQKQHQNRPFIRFKSPLVLLVVDSNEVVVSSVVPKVVEVKSQNWQVLWQFCAMIPISQFPDWLNCMQTSNGKTSMQAEVGQFSIHELPQVVMQISALISFWQSSAPVKLELILMHSSEQSFSARAILPANVIYPVQDLYSSKDIL